MKMCRAAVVEINKMYLSTNWALFSSYRLCSAMCRAVRIRQYQCGVVVVVVVAIITLIQRAAFQQLEAT